MGPRNRRPVSPIPVKAKSKMCPRVLLQGPEKVLSRRPVQAAAQHSDREIQVCFGFLGPATGLGFPVEYCDKEGLEQLLEC
jgi:hypothetical protein